MSNNTGYQEFNYDQNNNGAFNYYKKGPGTYGVDVSNRYAQKFIEKNAHEALHGRSGDLRTPWAVHPGAPQRQRFPRA